MLKQAKELVSRTASFIHEISEDMFPVVLSREAEEILGSMTAEQREHMWRLASFPESDVRSGGPLYVEHKGTKYQLGRLKEF